MTALDRVSTGEAKTHAAKATAGRQKNAPIAARASRL